MGNVDKVLKVFSREFHSLFDDEIQDYGLLEKIYIILKTFLSCVVFQYRSRVEPVYS